MPDLHLAYSQTPRLTELLARWDAAFELEADNVRHQWTELAVWPAARNGTVAGSTGIEGNPLTTTEVDTVLSGGQVDAARPDIREVENYSSAIDLATVAAERPDFEWSTELLRRINAEIMAGLEDDEGGEYRQSAVNVGRVFEPAAWQLLPALMAALVTWLRAPHPEHALIAAGLAHLNVVSIHPWLNGNGRAARVVGSLVLRRAGVLSPDLLNVESDIRANRDEYFGVLQDSHGPSYAPDDHSATPFLEFFAAMCVRRIEARNELAAAVPRDLGVLLFALDGRPTPEQAAIVLSARLAPVRTSWIAEALGVSPGRARAMLAALAAQGWLVALGDRRARRHGPSERLLALDLESPALMDRLRNPAPRSRTGPD